MKKFVVEFNKSFSVQEMQSILDDLFLLDLKKVSELKENNKIKGILKKHYNFAKKIKSKDDMSLINDIYWDLTQQHLSQQSLKEKEVKK